MLSYATSLTMIAVFASGIELSTQSTLIGYWCNWNVQGQDQYGGDEIWGCFYDDWNPWTTQAPASWKDDGNYTYDFNDKNVPIYWGKNVDEAVGPIGAWILKFQSDGKTLVRWTCEADAYNCYYANDRGEVVSDPSDDWYYTSPAGGVTCENYYGSTFCVDTKKGTFMNEFCNDMNWCVWGDAHSGQAPPDGQEQCQASHESPCCSEELGCYTNTSDPIGSQLEASLVNGVYTYSNGEPVPDYWDAANMDESVAEQLARVYKYRDGRLVPFTCTGDAQGCKYENGWDQTGTESPEPGITCFLGHCRKSLTGELVILAHYYEVVTDPLQAVSP